MGGFITLLLEDSLDDSLDDCRDRTPELPKVGPVAHLESNMPQDHTGC